MTMPHKKNRVKPIKSRPVNHIAGTAKNRLPTETRPSDTDRAYAGRIQACRLKLNYGIPELAKTIGVTAVRLYNAELSGVRLPEKALAKLAEISGMSYRWLLHGSMSEPTGDNTNDLDRTEPSATDKTRDKPAKPKPRCYIAGPISSNPDYRMHFDAGKSEMMARGYDVISPVDVERAMGLTEMTRAEIMNLGIYLLNMCDTIALLPGYTKSKGCAMELAYATANNKTIIELSDLNA